MGGNSLQAVRVLNRLEQRLGVRVYIAVVFEAPTVRQLAALLENDYAADISDFVEDHAAQESYDREEFTL